MKRTGGLRRKTRSMLRKNIRKRGKVSITKYFQRFSEGERVIFVAEPSIHGGLYPRRIHGKSGIVKSKRGECYIVEVKEINKLKTIIVHPVHLRGIKQNA